MKKYLMAALTAVAVMASSVQAQDKDGDDRFAKAFFDPQLVLKHAKEINLTAPQRKSIMDAIKKIQGELVPLQLDMTEPALEMAELVEQTTVDEAAAVAKADKVLKIENEVKKMQMALLIRIKNVLTKEQQAQLRTLRDSGRGDAPDGSDDAANQEETR